ENAPTRGSTRTNRRTPGTCDDPLTAPGAGSQAAATMRTTTAAAPARSWSRGMTERPSLTATLVTVQPGRRDSTQGTSDADGTDWAISHSGSRSLQPTSTRALTPTTLAPSGVLTATSLLSVQVRSGP